MREPSFSSLRAVPIASAVGSDSPKTVATMTEGAFDEGDGTRWHEAI